jgi:arginyl-tRNA synthetase
VISLYEQLRERLGTAFGVVAGGETDPAVRRSKRADFQADGAMALAGPLGRAPREIAAEVVGRVELDGLCSRVEITGPGFINMTIDDEALGRLTAAMVSSDRLGVDEVAAKQRVVVDYSAPNVAKEMHVGHLRSTVIGDAAVRLLEWLGHEVIRENHIGDWGTPFGMLIEHLLDTGETEAAHELSVGDLDSFYKTARSKFDADEGFADRARKRVVMLQSGDETTLRLWQVLINESEKYFMAVYDRLEVRLAAEDFAGESSYSEKLPSVVEELDELGLLRDSEGAKCVFPNGFANREGNPQPLIVQKRDGGYGYASTDLATIRHRARDLGADRLLYVVGLPQRQHLEMVFQAAREAGWLSEAISAEHIGFGSVLGTDGKLLRSRAGDSAKLVDLIDESVRRAAAAVAEKSPDLDEASRAEVARMVGIGAIKHADLSSERIKDYVFDYDQMLAFEGSTAPYLQYAHARIRSIFRRGGVEPPGVVEQVIVTEPAERQLALELLGFGDLVSQVADSLDLHRLTHYLFGLATAFTSFYETCPVLRADDEVRDSRLALCDVTARTLACGMSMLGITAPDRM